MKKLYIASLFLAIGCSHPAQVAAPTKPVIVETKPAQVDLKLISNENWSFAVPSDYQEIDISPNNRSAGIKAFLKSGDDRSALIFGAEETDLSLVDYTFAVGRKIQDNNMEVVNVYSGTIAGNEGKMITFVASPEAAGMNFITIVKGKAYSLTCYTVIQDIPNKSCLKIVQTVEIK